MRAEQHPVPADQQDGPLDPVERAHHGRAVAPVRHVLRLRRSWLEFPATSACPMPLLGRIDALAQEVGSAMPRRVPKRPAVTQCDIILLTLFLKAKIRDHILNAASIPSTEVILSTAEAFRAESPLKCEGS